MSQGKFINNHVFFSYLREKIQTVEIFSYSTGEKAKKYITVSLIKLFSSDKITKGYNLSETIILPSSIIHHINVFTKLFHLFINLIILPVLSVFFLSHLGSILSERITCCAKSTSNFMTYYITFVFSKHFTVCNN